MPDDWQSRAGRIAAAARSRERQWSEWIGAAQRFPWAEFVDVESAGLVESELPQPLPASRQAAALLYPDGTRSAVGVAVFVGTFWSVPDAVVAASVMVTAGLITADPYDGQLGDWPRLLPSGDRFSRCLIDGCAAPVYSQVHLLGAGGRPPTRCLMHTPKLGRAATRGGLERERVVKCLGRFGQPD